MRYLPTRSQARPSDDPIFALNREATQRRAAGEAIINGTVGAMLEDDGRLAILPSVVEALHAVPAARAQGYAPIAGDPAFLEAVIHDTLGGTPLEAQAVAVSTPGGTGALRHAIATFLERGEALLTTSYYWGPYLTICDEHERRLETFPMFDGAGRFDVAGLERALLALAATQGRLLVFLNDPCHNPTGYALSDEEWQETVRVLTAVARRTPLTVLADIAYFAFGKRHAREIARHLSPLAEHALVLFAWSASKAFTAYGLRVGALIACTADPVERAAVRNALTFACRATWSNCNAPGQVAITNCLGEPTLRARVDAERDRVCRLLAERVDAWNRHAIPAGLSFPRYEGGFFVTVFAADAPAAAASLRDLGIFLVPQKGALRVALCGVVGSDVPRLVSGLGAVLGASGG